MFTNVTTAAGLNYTGRCWGASWGDFTGNGSPDLWVSKHNSHIANPQAEDVTLYVNQVDGTFAKASLAQLPRVLKDFHQGVWADYDNDGDQDMMETTGSTSKGGLTLFQNNTDTQGNRSLTDQSAQSGVDATFKLIGRGVMWFDYNNDGLLDVFVGADSRADGSYPATIMKQLPNHTFVDARAETGLDITSAVQPMISDLDGDGRPELILSEYGAIVKIYDTTTLPFTNIKGSVLGTLSIPHFADMAIADFNNDGRPDIYMTRNGYGDQVVFDGNSMRTWIGGGNPKSMTFDTSGPVKFTFSNQDTTEDFSKVYVGAKGLNLIGNDQNPTLERSFTLDPNNPDHIGIKPHGNQDVGVYVGYDQSTGHWDYQVFVGAKPARGVLIDSQAPIVNVQEFGFDGNPAAPDDQLLINRLVAATGKATFADRSLPAGLHGMSVQGSNLAAGDFDNDGDIDLYIDQSGPAANAPNVLLQNQGYGKFVTLLGADGAPGSLAGTGGAVSIADYDRDGFLDVALLNGCGVPPFIPNNNDGPLELYHNNGNTNAWIAMRLHGTQSNADGIGARVLVTTGSKVQMRDATHGQSLDGQDFSGIHFGLGRLAPGSDIDKIEVRWPSGAKTILDHQHPGQFLDIYEPSAALDTPADAAMHADAGDASGADGLPALHLAMADGDPLLSFGMSFDTLASDSPDRTLDGTFLLSLDNFLGGGQDPMTGALTAFFDGSSALGAFGADGMAADATAGSDGATTTADAGSGGGDWLVA